MATGNSAPPDAPDARGDALNARPHAPDARTRVGILGLGRFGAFAASRLARDFSVVATDLHDRRDVAARAGARWATLEEVAACPWVVAAVPIRALRPAFTELAPRLAPGSVVVEVCSVKALPLSWLVELLPRGVSAVATHPLFGPDSAARSLRGLPLVLCPLPGGGRAARRLAAYARSRGLSVVRLEPEEHDRVMARTQALTFFLSRVLARLDLPEPSGPLATLSYRRLRAALESVARDSDELYHDLVRFNPHAMRSVTEIERLVIDEARALASLDRG